ncbi:MAG TPA: dTMP kinase [Candidatus Limnocylindrales bacterium]|nr:dTMP kinase [Candidatus Limnocylindrales bacterium]
MTPIDRTRGRFLTLEGPEGAGKTLMAERLAGALRASGVDVLLTREPGGTRLGERLRDILLAHDDLGIDPLVDGLLFNAARAQLMAEVIRPALAAGQVVVCARFADSTLAYQGYGSGVDLDALRQLAAVATGGLAPDRTILLDLPAEAGLRRKSPDDHTRFEAAFDLEFHRRVRAGFLDLAAREPDRFVVIDAGGSVEDVFAAVLAAARAALDEPVVPASRIHP